jgi:hypothetical protein
LQFLYKCQKTWFEIKERSLNLKCKPHNIYDTNQTCNYMVWYYLGIAATIVALGVSQPPPPNRKIDVRFGWSSGSNRNREQSHIPSLWQHEIRMTRTKKVLAFPRCFFFGVVAPLYL